MSIKQLREIPTGSLLAGALNAGEVWKFSDFRPISRYFSQMIQDRYHRKWNRTQAFKWYQFQWPWVT